MSWGNYMRFKGAVIAAAIVAGAMSPANAAVVFSNNFDSGLSASETVTGNFSVSGGYLGHHALYQNNESSTYTIQTALDATSVLSFDYNVMTESCCDTLRIFVNNFNTGTVYFGTMNGRANLSLASFAGPATIRFQFLSDGSVVSTGIRIDNLEITGSGVPEPASWAMMLGGFGLVGGAMRRHSKTQITLA